MGVRLVGSAALRAARRNGEPDRNPLGGRWIQVSLDFQVCTVRPMVEKASNHFRFGQ